MIHLFHVSDAHFGAEDAGALDWFARCVAEERPDAILFTGDLTMRATPAEFAAGANWLASLRAPVAVVIGNHDIPYYSEPARRLLDPYSRFAAVRQAIDRPLAIPGISIVPLQTVARVQWRFDQSQGRVSRAALAGAIAAIAAAPTGDAILVTAHHPLVNPTDHGGYTRGGRRALAALAEAGATAVLSGHVHDPFDLVWRAGPRSIRSIGAGTLSKRTRKSPASFNELRLDGGDLTVISRVASTG